MPGHYNTISVAYERDWDTLHSVLTHMRAYVIRLK